LAGIIPQVLRWVAQPVYPFGFVSGGMPWLCVCGRCGRSVVPPRFEQAGDAAAKNRQLTHELIHGDEMFFLRNGVAWSVLQSV